VRTPIGEGWSIVTLEGLEPATDPRWVELEGPDGQHLKVELEPADPRLSDRIDQLMAMLRIKPGARPARKPGAKPGYELADVVACVWRSYEATGRRPSAAVVARDLGLGGELNDPSRLERRVKGLTGMTFADFRDLALDALEETRRLAAVVGAEEALRREGEEELRSLGL